MACPHCAGVTVGLLAREGDRKGREWELVTDPGSLEEGLGAMQLHAAGTSRGFTALQLVCNGSGADGCPQIDLHAHASMSGIYSPVKVDAGSICFLQCCMDQARFVLASSAWAGGPGRYTQPE